MKSNSIDNSNDEQILIWQQVKLIVSIGDKKEMLNYQKNQAIHFDNYGQSKKTCYSIHESSMSSTKKVVDNVGL